MPPVLFQPPRLPPSPPPSPRGSVVGRSADEDDSFCSAKSHQSFPGGSSPNSSIATVVRSGLCGITLDWKAFLLGQLLAIALALRGALSAVAVTDCALSAPTVPLAGMYGLLLLHLAFLCCRQRLRGGVGSHRNDTNGFGVQSARRSTGFFSSKGEKGSDSSTDEEVATRGSVFNRGCGGGGGCSTASPQPPHLVASNDRDCSSKDKPLYRLPPTSLALHLPWSYYAFVAFLDVESNVLTYAALQYTSFKSAALLDCLAIPAAMIVSRFLLKRRYTAIHLFGAFVCLVGATVAVMADYEEEVVPLTEQPQQQVAEVGGMQTAADDGGTAQPMVHEEGMPEYPYAMHGDMLATFGGILYGIVDALAERSIKKCGGQTEFLGMLGLFAFPVSAIQVFVMERTEVLTIMFGSTSSSQGVVGVVGPEASACTIQETQLLTAGTIIAFYLYYVGVGRFLLFSEAALLNLSLLTADVWVVFFAWLEQDEFPTHLFVASMVVIVSGVFIYEMAPSPIVAKESIDEDESLGGKYGDQHRHPIVDVSSVMT